MSSIEHFCLYRADVWIRLRHFKSFIITLKSTYTCHHMNHARDYRREMHSL